MNDKSAAEQAIEKQAEEKRRAAADGAAEEGHAGGERGKPTARDATGAKQEGFKDDDDEDEAEEEREAAERDHLRKQGGSSLP